MTRINLVAVKDLADQHLFAEWREAKMVPAALRRSLKTKSVQEIIKSIPKRYTLNTGHVSFFFNKMKFLQQRHEELTDELYNRQYNITDCDSREIFLNDILGEFKTVDWQPDRDEISVSIDRIVIRLNEKPDWYRYHGDITPPMWFEDRYELFRSSRPN